LLSAGGFLVFRTVPAVQPLALEGLGMTIGLRDLAVIALGFGCFAAGLVARVLAPPAERPEGEAPPPPRPGLRSVAQLLRAVAALALGLVILSSLAEIQARYAPRGERLASTVLEPIRARGAEAWRWLAGPGGLGGTLALDPSVWLPLPAVPWLLWRGVGLLASAKGRPA
jgi:hypothetical protein